MAFRLQFQCFICEMVGNPRQMPILRENDIQKVNIAQRRREELLLPQIDVNINSRLCVNCNLSIIDEIQAYEDDPDPTILILPLKFNIRHCLVCNNDANIQNFSSEARTKIFVRKGIYIPSICKVCHVYLDANGFLLFPLENGIRTVKRPYNLKGEELAQFLTTMREGHTRAVIFSDENNFNDEELCAVIFKQRAISGVIWDLCKCECLRQKQKNYEKRLTLFFV